MNKRDDPPSTLPALLRQVVSRRGRKPAIVTAEETVSYTDLDNRSARMARALLAAGVAKGTRIGLLAPDGIFWIISFLAALRIGALVTPISTLSTSPELTYTLRHSDVQVLIGVRRFMRHDYAATLIAALPGVGAARPGALRLPDAPYLRTIWLDNADGLNWARPVDELLALADGDDAPDASLLAVVEAEVVASDEAVIVHTSGSTAQPKAVVHCQWPIARHSLELARYFLIRPNDRVMCLLPLFWLAGLSTMLQVLGVGATQIYPRSLEIESALAMIANFGVTRVNAWGDRHPRLVEAAKRNRVDLSAIPDLSGFGERSGKLRAPRAAMYGMTESFSAHSAEPMDRCLPDEKSGSFGRSINGYERRVVDPKTGMKMTPGEVGELQIRGPALMTGFYKRSRSEVFTPDGFYPTRDLVRIDSDGHLYPEGRLDDMIKTRGANVSRLEVEAALISLPGVLIAVVAGLLDPHAGKIVAAAVVAEEGAQLIEEKLRVALREKLSSFKVPRFIVFITEDDIPRTSTGKIKMTEATGMIADRLTGNGCGE